MRWKNLAYSFLVVIAMGAVASVVLMPTIGKYEDRDTGFCSDMPPSYDDLAIDCECFDGDWLKNETGQFSNATELKAVLVCERPDGKQHVLNIREVNMSDTQ